jgi:type I restriction enzyme S subunit
LQNAKELFESYLNNVFEDKGDDWEEKTLGEVIEALMILPLLQQRLLQNICD